MKTIAEKRKEFMKVLCGTMDRLDPTGANSKRYHEMLDKMSDAQFDKWARQFFKDDKQQFYLEIIEYERDINYDQIDNAAKYLGVPLYETVYLPYINHSHDNVATTPYPVPVGYVHEKRMMQMLEKKNSGSTSIEHRSPLTGQVIGDDKNARNTDVETYSMLAIDANAALAEFLGPRSDDMVAKNQMLSQIAANGYASMADITTDKANKTSLNTLAIYFLMQGFRTNIIGSGGMLPQPANMERTDRLNEKDKDFV